MSTDVEQATEGRSEVFAIGEPGRAAIELSAGPPTRFSDSADHELSEHRVPGASVRAASVRGLLHRYRAQPRQDRFSVVFDEPNATLIVTVCDGVGQFTYSHEAAAFAASNLPRAFLVHRDWEAAVTEVNDGLKRLVATIGDRPHLDPVPADLRMATTLVATAIHLDPENRYVSVAWTGDSSAWIIDDGQWRNLTPNPEPDDEANGLYSGRVKALPHAEPRLTTAEYSLGAGPLFVMTDGVGVPLQGSAQVREMLAAWWATAPNLFTFAQQVGFARKGHMDDRTAVGVWAETDLP